MLRRRVRGRQACRLPGGPIRQGQLLAAQISLRQRRPHHGIFGLQPGCVFQTLPRLREIVAAQRQKAPVELILKGLGE